MTVPPGEGREAVRELYVQMRRTVQVLGRCLESWSCRTWNEKAAESDPAAKISSGLFCFALPHSMSFRLDDRIGDKGAIEHAPGRAVRRRSAV